MKILISKSEILNKFKSINSNSPTYLGFGALDLELPQKCGFMHPYQSLEAIGSFVFLELKAKDYASTFNKLLQWSKRFLKNSQP